MENNLILIKSAVASGGKQHPLSTERQQQQQVENHIHYFLGKPNSVPTERAVGACGKSNALFKPNLGGLFRGPFWGGGTGKITPPPTPCLEPVRIMQETLNVVRKHIHICGFRKYGFSHQGHLDFANISIFLQKKRQ